MSVHIGDHVGNLLQRPAMFAGPDDTLRSVAHTLWSESIGVVVIGDERHALGILSERDIVEQLAQGVDPDVKTAGEAMTPHVILARPEDLVHEVAGQMLDDGIRHLPVIDQDRRVAGMVSVRDLLRPLLLDALSGLDPQPDRDGPKEDPGVQ
jgi:CBS domain-containing protein